MKWYVKLFCTTLLTAILSGCNGIDKNDKDVILTSNDGTSNGIGLQNNENKTADTSYEEVTTGIIQDNDEYLYENEDVRQILYNYLRDGYFREIMTPYEFEQAFNNGKFLYLGKSAENRFCYYEGLIIAPSSIEVNIQGFQIKNKNQMIPSKIGIYVIDGNDNVKELENAELSESEVSILYDLLPDEMK